MSKRYTTKKAFTWLLKWTLWLKKGGYLLSRIALFDTVYHRCMDGMVAAIFHIAQNEQLKKRSLDCSNERFNWKKAATYSPALPYLTRCTISAWTVRQRRFPILTKWKNEKAFTWLLKWTLRFKKRRLPTLPHCPIWHGVPSVVWTAWLWRFPILHKMNN